MAAKKKTSPDEKENDSARVAYSPEKLKELEASLKKQAAAIRGHIKAMKEMSIPELALRDAMLMRGAFHLENFVDQVKRAIREEKKRRGII